MSKNFGLRIHEIKDPQKFSAIRQQGTAHMTTPPPLLQQSTSLADSMCCHVAKHTGESLPVVRHEPIISSKKPNYSFENFLQKSPVIPRYLPIIILGN